jgi:hypothetical protein
MRPKIPKIEALRPSAGWLRRCSGQGTHVQALSGPADQPAASPRELLAIIPDNPGVVSDGFCTPFQERELVLMG